MVVFLLSFVLPSICEFVALLRTVGVSFVVWMPFVEFFFFLFCELYFSLFLACRYLDCCELFFCYVVRQPSGFLYILVAGRGGIFKGHSGRRHHLQ